MRFDLPLRIVFAGALAALSALPLQAFELDLEVQGSDLRDRLSAASRLVQLTTQETPPEPQDIVAAAQADYGVLVSALYETGHYGGIVTIRIDGREAASISQLDLPQRVGRVAVSVQTGAPFRFGRADIAPRAPGSRPPAGFAPDASAELGQIRAAVDQGIADWQALGHARAALASQDIVARHGMSRLDAMLRLAPGRVYRFGEVIVRQGSDVRPDRLRAIAGLPVGARYDPAEIAAAERRLRRTGTFGSATLDPSETDGPNDTIDMILTASDRPKRSFGFGAELASFEGLTLSGYWQHRNLLGGAERLRVEAEVAGIGGDSGGEDTRLRIRFDRPATFNQDTDFYIESEAETRNDVDFSSQTLHVFTGLRRYASPQQEYDVAIGLMRGLSNDAFGQRDYNFLTLHLGAQLDYRDAPLDAKNGWYADLRLTPLFGLTGSDDGLLTTADLRGYRSFGADDRLTVAARVQLGSLDGLALAQAPSDMLFYSGGGGTVRGQPFQSNAIDLGGGLRSGGRAFLGLSTEVRFEITDRIGAAGFFDTGYIGPESFPDGSTGQWHSGAGFGLRYQTGVGAIRVDLAAPVSGPGNEGPQIYIGIGQAF